MKVRSFIICTGIILIVWSCTHHLPVPPDNGGSTNPPPTVTCSPDSVYFQNTILPLISSNCAMADCHDPISHREGLILNNYTGIMKIVRAGNPNSSKLYETIADNSMPPPPYPKLTTAQRQSVQKWIQQGATNNGCSSGCDSSIFTYTGAIVPLMDTYCKGCHNTTLASGNVDLSNYNAVKTVVGNGKLMGSITHASGFVAMPQGGNKLSDCQISQVDKWIKAGALNN